MAAAERALRRGFVQFLDVEPVNRVLRRSRDRPRDVMDDVIVDFTEDESPPPTSFADVAALLPAASASSSAIADLGLGLEAPPDHFRAVLFLPAVLQKRSFLLLSLHRYH